MNDFYKQTKIWQWIQAILLLIIGFIPALSLIDLSFSHPVYYLLIILYVPVGQFAFTPFFTLIGIYKYYSPMLLGYMANNNQIDLHSGGSFDYLFVMKNYKAGLEIRNKLLFYHIDGLIKIIELIENKALPETVKIVGTSYFFNDRTLKKAGFEIVNPSLLYRINLFVNFIDLLWMYSLSQGKFSLPKLWKAKKASITGAKLIESKKVLEALKNNLEERTKMSNTDNPTENTQ